MSSSGRGSSEKTNSTGEKPRISFVTASETVVSGGTGDDREMTEEKERSSTVQRDLLAPASPGSPQTPTPFEPTKSSSFLDMTQTIRVPILRFEEPERPTRSPPPPPAKELPRRASSEQQDAIAPAAAAAPPTIPHRLSSLSETGDAV